MSDHDRAGLPPQTTFSSETGRVTGETAVPTGPTIPARPSIDCNELRYTDISRCEKRDASALSATAAGLPVLTALAVTGYLIEYPIQTVAAVTTIPTSSQDLAAHIDLEIPRTTQRRRVGLEPHRTPVLAVCSRCRGDPRESRYTVDAVDAVRARRIDADAGPGARNRDRPPVNNHPKHPNRRHARTGVGHGLGVDVRKNFE